MSQVRKTCGDRASRKGENLEAAVKAVSSRMEPLGWGRCGRDMTVLTCVA